MQHLTIINSLYNGLDVCLSVSVIVTEFKQGHLYEEVSRLMGNVKVITMQLSCKYLNKRSLN